MRNGLVMGVTAHAKDVIECISPIETCQLVTGFGQQGFSYIIAPLFEVKVANHTDMWVGALSTVFIPSEIRLPALNETQHLTTLCRQVRFQALEDRLTLQFVLEEASLPFGG